MSTTYSGRIFEVGDVIYFSKFGTTITSGYAPKSGTFGTCYGTISKLYDSSYAFPIVINGTVHAGTGGTFTACTVKPSDVEKGYQVKVTYSHNGGSGTSSQTGYVGATLTGTSSRTGYQFAGWYTAASGGTKVTTLPSDSTTLYAHWTANTFYVSFNGNGNTGGSTAKETFSYGTAKALTSNGFTRTGYTFSKWNTKADGSGTSYTNGQSVSNLTTTNGGTVTLYAIWTANTYYVKFNGNGNTGGSTAQETFTYGTAKALTSNGFTRTGYTFSKWNTNSSGTGTSYTNGQSVKNLTATSGGTVNLYAIWTANTFYVQFNGNGNTGGSTAKETFTYGTAKALTANGFTKTGYTFKGWATTAARANAGTVDYTNKQSVSNLTATSGGTYNLYAVWTANTYYVAFNGNGSQSGSMSKETFTYGTAKALTANAFSRGVAYKFSGWNTKADGTGTSYSDKQSVSNLTSTAGGTVTLYAKWTLQYIAPTIKNVAVLRYEDGVEDDAGTQLHIEFDWAVDTVVPASNYATSVKVETKPYGSSTWTTLTETTYSSASSESQSGSFAYTSETGLFDTETSYNIRISITDNLGPTVGAASPQVTATDFLSQAFFTMDWAAGGKGIGIGVVAPTEGLNIGMATKFLDDVLIEGVTYSELGFKTTSGGSVSYIRAYADSSQSVYGNNVIFNAKGNLVLGGGESAQALYDNNIDWVASNKENVYISADGEVYIYTNCNTISDRSIVSITARASIVAKSYVTFGETDTVTSNVYSSMLSWADSNGNSLGYMEGYKTASDVIYNRIVARRHINGSSSYTSAQLGVGVDASGNAVALVAGTGLADSFRNTIGAVHKTGDTMTGDLVVEKSTDSKISLDSSSINSKMGTTRPSDSQTIGSYMVRDSNNYSCGWLQVIKNTSGGIRLELYASRPDASGTRVSHGVALVIDDSGNRSVSMHSPAAWRSALGVSNIQTKTVTASVNSQSCISLGLNCTTTVVLAMCNTGSSTAYDLSVATLSSNNNWYAHVTTTTGNANLANGTSVTVLVYYMTV